MSGFDASEIDKKCINITSVQTKTEQNAEYFDDQQQCFGVGKLPVRIP